MPGSRPDVGGGERGRGALKRAALLLLAAMALLAGYGALIEPAWIAVTRHAVAAPLTSPLRVAHLSDLHLTGWARREDRILARLEEERPDVVVITGDSVAEGEEDTEVAYAPVARFLRRLRAPRGVFLVRGNWENGRPLRPERAFYENVGVRLLVNQSARVRDDVWVLGLDEAWNGTPDVEEARKGMPGGVFAIALFHSPGGFAAVAGRADLALGGHTHGGQVRVPLLPPLWLPPSSDGYVAGWYARSGTRFYISRGLGTSVVPFRLFCRPELAIHTLAP